MKKHASTIILILLFFAGLSLLLYPSVSNWWNQRAQKRVLASYKASIEEYAQEDFEDLLCAARAYNETLVDNAYRYILDEEAEAQYNSLLDATGSGVMAQIEIPAINVSLPVYHGTGDAVLQAGVGHIEGTSLPVGGENTHCALSGHRGLPSAMLFTNLNKLAVGDTFSIRTLSELLTYQVDRISIVLPSDIRELEIQHGRDLCTLVTCTPYGVNSHRLLVRGTRIENPEESKIIYITPEAYPIDSLILAPIIAIPILLILVILLLFRGKKPPKGENLNYDL